jgi:predicted RNA-binding Zn ribbon-like protein
MTERQRTTGQRFSTPEGTRWFFDAGALSLDFAHTGGVEERPEWEQLGTPRELTDWLRAHVDGYDGRREASRRDVARAAGLRAAVIRLARLAAAGRPLWHGDVDVVNGVALRPDVPRVLPGRSTPSVSVGQALSTVARDAVDVMAKHRDRVRECGADDCPLVFLDLSRAGNRRWCSMQRCGNRHKVRSHRARSL